MPKTVNMNIRVDSDSKTAAEQIYRRLGLSLPDAIRIFIEKSLYVGGLPFDLRLDQPNAETLAAMVESEQLLRDPDAPTFSSMTELIESLNSDE